jgi:membrane protein YqaA with SNARE-associated domain
VPPYLELFLVILAVNLMPAFGPPTWAVLVLYKLNHDMAALPLVAIGAAAAAAGRLGLAGAFRLLGDRLPERTRRNLDGARHAIAGHAHSRILALGLFALSPLPSAQLFEAAGLARLPLVSFTAAFFAGRVVSYSLYVSATEALESRGLADAFAAALKSPWGLAMQFAMLAALALFTQLDWHRIRASKYWPGNRAKA